MATNKTKPVPSTRVTQSKLNSPSISSNPTCGLVDDITVGHFSLEEGTTLSVSLKEFVANTKIASSIAEGMWKKAAMKKML